MNTLVTERLNKKGVSRVAVSTENERVYVTLPKEVVDKLRRMAENDMRTLSAMTAIMVLRGLEATERGVKFPLGGD